MHVENVTKNWKTLVWFSKQILRAKKLDHGKQNQKSDQMLKKFPGIC